MPALPKTTHDWIRFGGAAAKGMALALSYRLGLRETPVLVYQFGKVGSRAIHDSIRGYRDCVHTHNLNGSYLQPLVRGSVDRDGIPWRIISLCRDPVARNLSAFFQNLDNPDHPFHMGRPETLRVLPLDRFVDFFFSRPFAVHEVPVTWFDSRFQQGLGIPVYSTPFDRRGGASVGGRGAVKVLILKYERLAEVGPKAIGEFIGVPELTLARRNVSEDKWYAGIYRRFRREVPFPPRYLQRLYDTPYMRHFYEPAEIEAFRRKWTSR